MNIETVEFNHNSRTVYTAAKRVIENCGQFSRIGCNDDTFVVAASHGWRFPPLGEDIKIRTVATGKNAAKVVESKSKVMLNVFAGNKQNVSDLVDYISNGVYQLMDPDDIEIATYPIYISQPEIKLKK